MHGHNHGGQHSEHEHVAPPSGGQHAPHNGHAGHGSSHDRHAGHSVAMFRDRFWISLVLTIPTLVWGHMLPSALGYMAPHIPYGHLIPAIFGTAVFLYGGLVFIRGAGQELQDRRPGMMTLIALAISVAFVFSLMVTLGFPGMPLWEELATLVTIMILGHWIEMRSISQAQGALQELARLLPSRATRVRGDTLEDIDIAELREGDIVLVRPGEGVPADGTVLAGQSAVNESMITGESTPVDKTEGATVIAGTVNGTGSLRFTVTATGNRTALASIMRLVQQAQSSRSTAQDLADRAAFILTIVALAAGVATLTIWLGAGAAPSFAVERTVATLVIACPHALGLAIPLVIAISTTLGARHGLLVRDRRGLEQARRINTVVFDKTGTLTLGQLRVVTVATTDDIGEAEALRLAAAVEGDSQHPIGAAIVQSAHERGLDIPETTSFESITGQGVRAIVAGRTVEAGGPNLLRARDITLPAALERAATTAAERGQSSIFLLLDDRVVALFAVADRIRPESREAVERLRSLGIEVVMMTGDARAVAEAVASELHIDTVYAEVLPRDKASTIQTLQQTKRVAMVGDGVNDAPALVTADVGIAIGAGTHVAVEAGDVVLVRNDPRDVPRIIALSRASYRKMLENLAWATGYNVIAIPLAAGVLAHRGVLLSPAVGAVLMSVSTIIVALNAQLLRRTRL